MADIIGKPVDTMTPAELAAQRSSLQAQLAALETAYNSIKEAAEKTEFANVITAYKLAAKNLGWAKLPGMFFLPNADGTDAELKYVTKTVRGTGPKGTKTGNGGHTVLGPGEGKITIKKIIDTVGPLDHFEYAGKPYESPIDLMKVLPQPDKDGKPTTHMESERCEECLRGTGKHGSSFSELVLRYHAADVIIAFADKSQMTFGDAAKKYTESVEKANAKPATPPAPATTEVPV